MQTIPVREVIGGALDGALLTDFDGEPYAYTVDKNGIASGYRSVMRVDFRDGAPTFAKKAWVLAWTQGQEVENGSA